MEYPAYEPIPTTEMVTHCLSSGVRVTPVGVPEFKQLSNQLESQFPQLGHIQPGSEFGAFRGELIGLMDDFSWHGRWTLFVKREAWERLSQCNLMGVVTVAAHISNLIDCDEAIEFHIEPRFVRLAASCEVEPAVTCQVCGRHTRKKPQTIILERSSLPDNCDLFRGEHLTTTLFATERFVSAVLSCGLNGLVVQEVALS